MIQDQLGIRMLQDFKKSYGSEMENRKDKKRKAGFKIASG